MKKKFLWNVIVIFVVSMLLNMNCVGEGTLEQNMSLAYGWLDFRNLDALIVSFMRWILPQIALCGFWGNYMEEQLLHYLPYILTRTRKPEQFFRRVYGKLSGISILFCLGFLIIPILISIFGRNLCLFDENGWEKVGLWICYQLLCLVFVNAISIFLGAVYGTGILLCIEIFMFFFYKMMVMKLIPRVFIKILPISAVWFFDGSTLQQPHWSGMLLFVIITGFIVIVSTRVAVTRDIM